MTHLIRTVTAYYTNPTPDPTANDLHDTQVTTYQSVPSNLVAAGAITVADVDGEAPPAGHSWVQVGVKAPAPGYDYDPAVDAGAYEAWKTSLGVA